MKLTPINGKCIVPSFVSLVNEIVDVSKRRHNQLRQVLDVRTQQWVLAYSEIVPVLGVQQVTNPLTVDLHVTHLGHTMADKSPFKTT